MGIKSRLELIIKDLGISGRTLSKECGFSESYFSTINDGIGADKLNKILSRYPNISARWLITGEGERYEENNCQTNAVMTKKCISEENFFAYVKERDIIYMEILRQNGEMLQHVLSKFDKQNE